MYASPPPLRRTILVAAAVLAIALGACGGNGDEGASKTQRVAGPGFTFEVPSGREVTRTPRSVSVVPTDAGSREVESVTRFPLVKVYRPSLWPKAIVELDSVAERLTARLGGEYTNAIATTRIGGLRGRRYEIAFERNGEALRQRLTLLLDTRTEYQLLCRWSAAGDEPKACALVERTFAPVRPR